jgi:hypothetical protein
LLGRSGNDFPPSFFIFGSVDFSFVLIEVTATRLIAVHIGISDQNS